MGRQREKKRREKRVRGYRERAADLHPS